MGQGNVTSSTPSGSRLRLGEVFAYVGRNQNLKDLKERKQGFKPLFSGSLLRKGEVLAYVGLIQNLKDLQDPADLAVYSNTFKLPQRGFCRDFPRKSQVSGYGWIASILKVLKVRALHPYHSDSHNKPRLRRSP